MFDIACARSLPKASAEGSLNRAGSVDAWVGAGVGVPGAAGVDEETGAGAAGAAGAAGVWAGGGAGVEGAAWLDDPAGGALGFDTMHTTNPFSSMLYDSTVLPSCKIFPTRLIVSMCAAPSEDR